MASDITEEFQVDISGETQTVPVAVNTGIKHDFAFAGETFFDATSPDLPYRRQTAQYRKDQSDNSAEPGEQSLSGWWLRSQSSFHLGAGLNFYEPSQEQGYVQNQTIRYMFHDSQGVDVWTEGQVGLLPQVDNGHKTTGTAPTHLRPIHWDGLQGVLMVDEYDVDKIAPDLPRMLVTAKALTSNVATLTTPTAHGYAVGVVASVDDVDTTFNGVKTVTAIATLTPKTTTASGSSGASTVVVASATGISYGMAAVADGVASGAYVTGISGTTITLSAANTSTVSGSVTFSGYTFSYAKTASNVTNVAVSPAGYTSAGVVHFLDYNTGTADKVFSITDDGVTAFWLHNASSKWTVTKKPLSGSAADISDEVLVYQGAGVMTDGVIGYVKDRIVAAVNNVIYEINLSGAPSTLFTAKAAGTLFTDITSSPSDIYLSMYNGLRSEIVKLTTDDTGAIPVLDGAVVVAEMPRGEIVEAIEYYLGYVLIGTNKGVRVAQVGGDGGIVYGPILFETSQPVYQFATSDRFAWCTARVGTDAGLVRIDLGNPLDTLVFPYANDLQAVGTVKDCTGVSFVGNTDRLCFTAAADYTYFESATTLRESGYISTGKIRFATTEDKFFKYVKEDATYTGGSIGVSTDVAPITTVSVTTGNTDIGIPNYGALRHMQFTFTLHRDSADTAVGPTLWSYQVKALPAVKRQRMIQYNLYCFDLEQDSNGVRIGYKGRAWDRISMFEDMEAASDIITVQDFRTGEQYQGLIEECSFAGQTSRHKSQSGFGGILTVTVRKIS